MQFFWVMATQKSFCFLQTNFIWTSWDSTFGRVSKYHNAAPYQLTLTLKPPLTITATSRLNDPGQRSHRPIDKWWKSTSTPASMTWVLTNRTGSPLRNRERTLSKTFFRWAPHRSVDR